MRETAVLLANGLLQTPFAKTTHGLVRGPSRYRLLGVIDPEFSGQDAGDVIDGKPCDLPIFSSLPSMVEAVGVAPEVCIVGVATVGGVLPGDIHSALLEAATLGMTLVNGLHQQLADDRQISRRVSEAGGKIIDLRKPRPVGQLRFWSGEILRSATPRIAVLGTDCAVGKRTTTTLLLDECRERGMLAEMIYTGQTGWLQGIPHGFILDATPNDFVCGELEGAILGCQHDLAPELIFLEGQSGLRNPSGPCGAELLLAGASSGAILQHAPGRKYYEGLEDLECEIPPLNEEIEMIRHMGVEVWAVTLKDENLDRKTATQVRQRMALELNIPVVFPFRDGVGTVVDEIQRQLQAIGADE